jgi:hypothetical protein
VIIALDRLGCSTSRYYHAADAIYRDSGTPRKPGDEVATVVTDNPRILEIDGREKFGVVENELPDEMLKFPSRRTMRGPDFPENTLVYESCKLSGGHAAIYSGQDDAVSTAG